ncbi:MAG: ATPase P, partial [Tenericutes bacterium HGW-Tenericutes-8]
MTDVKATKVKDKKHKKDLVEVKRFDPEVTKGLTYQEVEERILGGYGNRTHSGSTKTIKAIILSNVLTLFNLLNIGIAGWLITVGAFKDLFFMIIISLNVGIGIYQ